VPTTLYTKNQKKTLEGISSSISKESEMELFMALFSWGLTFQDQLVVIVFQYLYIGVVEKLEKQFNASPKREYPTGQYKFIDYYVHPDFSTVSKQWLHERRMKELDRS
jgi:hypothetical protein